MSRADAWPRITKALLRVGGGVFFAFLIQWRNSLESNDIPAPMSSFWAVDNHTKIFFNENFLSAQEVEYLLQFVEKLGWGESKSGKELPLEGYVAAARNDPIFARVEERIANQTGIAVHPHEDILTMSRLTSHGDSPRDGYFPHGRLHHDSHERPHRTWTMIVYLQAPEEGGRTIFPLVGTKADERHRQFVAALQDLFGGKPQNYSRQAFFDVHSHHPFMDLIEECCRGAYGISFRPLAGSAVLFPSNTWSYRTWHAGCNVITGTKIIMEKFKEYPIEQRGKDEPLPPYQPFKE